VLMGFGVPQLSTTVGSVSECVVPATETRSECLTSDPAAPGARAGVLPGDRIVSLDQVAIDDWFGITEIIRQSPGQRLVLGVERDGALVELSITPLLSERYAFDDRGQIRIDDDGNPVIEYVGFVGIGSAVENEARPASAVLPAVWDNVVGVTRVIVTLPERLVDSVWWAWGGLREK